MDGTLTCFNILVEKRYPLIKEMLKKMLKWKLEAEAESTMAFELLKFIKSQFRGGLLGIMDFYNLVLLIQLDTAGDVPLDLSKDTKPYIKPRSSRSVHWDQQDSCIIKALRSPKHGFQLRLFKHNVPSARGSSLLIMPCKSSLMKFSSFLASN
ncbi:hypothetical protein Tco_0255479 [Tanacetum coccineum]